MRQKGARARVAQDVILWHPAHHLQKHDSLYRAFLSMACSNGGAMHNQTLCRGAQAAGADTAQKRQKRLWLNTVACGLPTCAIINDLQDDHPAPRPCSAACTGRECFVTQVQTMELWVRRAQAKPRYLKGHGCTP